MKLKGSQAIVKVLLEQGVDTVFGYPGGQVIPLYDALYDAPLKNVLTAHEQGAIHAADGYARVSGKVGVCIATSGPGATNIVTGLATAYLDSVPLVAITGQVPVSNLGRDSFQEIDIVGVTVPITKYNALVRRSEDLVPTLRKAFAIAREGRPGPVLVDVPSNLQAAELEWSELEEKEEMGAQNQAASLEEADKGNLLEAAELLNKAKQPVLLVGGGALNSDAGAELVALAEKADLPIVNTLMGVGVVPTSNERSLGMTGMHGHIASNMAVVHADVLVVAGSRFSERVTGDRTRFVGKKTIIQLDIDPSEIDKNIAVSVPLVGDIKKSLQKLLPLIKAAQHTVWWEQVKAWDASEDRSLEKGDHLTAPWLMKHLSTAMGSDTVYVTDVGQNQMWAAQHLVVDKPRHHLTSGGCGTMGFGLPAALGATFAVDNPMVHICGDGGFKMTGMELYTACREKKKLISIVINNSCLGMVRQWQHLFYDARYSSTILSQFDFIGFARSCGADGVQATTCEEFATALEKAKTAEGPFLIEAIIQQGDMVEPMVAPGAVLDDFVKVDK